jgi:hypothetical protein
VTLTFPQFQIFISTLMMIAQELMIFHFTFYPTANCRVLRRTEELAYDIDQKTFCKHIDVLLEYVTCLLYSANSPFLRAKTGKGTYGMQHI